MRKVRLFCLSFIALILFTGCADLFTAPDDNLPQRPSTNIQFTLEEDAHVLFFISNNNFELVKVLINEPMVAGNHTVRWYGQDENENVVASGVYYYTLMTDDYLATRAMLLVK